MGSDFALTKQVLTRRQKETGFSWPRQGLRMGGALGGGEQWRLGVGGLIESNWMRRLEGEGVGLIMVRTN